MMRVLVTGGSGFIGTNVIQHFLERDIDVMNVDIAEPRNSKHLSHWSKIDIRDFDALNSAVNDFSPTHLIHLAARTDLAGKNLEDYSSNIDGVHSILKALKNCSYIEKSIFASSMLVCSAGYIPHSSNDYSPTTVYGRSKVMSENIIKEYDYIPCQWNIIRPSSIWGPWFSEPYKNFFDFVMAEKYFHPGKMACTKTYGYIGNAVYQIDRLLFCNDVHINKKIFYIGDISPINISEWANEILEVAGKSPAKSVPFALFQMASLLGDVLGKFGIKFPMTSFRLNNMTTNNVLPLDDLYEVVGVPPYSRIDGIKETLNWLRLQD